MLLVDAVPYPRAYANSSDVIRYLVSHPGGAPLYVDVGRADGAPLSVVPSTVFATEANLVTNEYQLMPQTEPQRDRLAQLCHLWGLGNAGY